VQQIASNKKFPALAQSNGREISHEVCWSVLLSRRMVGTDRSPCVKVEPDERSAVRCHVTLPCWAQYTASTQKDR